MIILTLELLSFFGRVQVKMNFQSFSYRPVLPDLRDLDSFIDCRMAETTRETIPLLPLKGQEIAELAATPVCLRVNPYLRRYLHCDNDICAV